MAVALVNAALIEYDGVQKFVDEKVELKVGHRDYGVDFFPQEFEVLFNKQNPELDAIMAPKIEALLGYKLHSALDSQIGAVVPNLLRDHLIRRKGAFIEMYISKKISDYCETKLYEYFNGLVFPILNAEVSTDLAAALDTMISREKKYLVLQVPE